jgi:hypothetical protein
MIAQKNESLLVGQTVLDQRLHASSLHVSRDLMDPFRARTHEGGDTGPVRLERFAMPLFE